MYTGVCVCVFVSKELCTRAKWIVCPADAVGATKRLLYSYAYCADFVVERLLEISVDLNMLGNYFL